MSFVWASRTWAGVWVGVALVAGSAQGASGPRMICYYMQPNAYLNDHASELAEMYDGFFFNVGSWEKSVARFLGGPGAKPEEQDWRQRARQNLASLRQAGATENFLTVAFHDSGAWPSPQTLLTKSYSQMMTRQFGAIGRVAKDLGFRGVCIDVEYPYQRYALDHEIYTYEGYTAEDLVAAARAQGRACMAGLLDAFPEAVIIVLPGSLRSRPIGRAYQLGLLEAMAERDAPGGFHLGSEYTYCLHDPVTTLAATRFDDPVVPLLASPRAADYWRRRCTIAPGVWPLHMVETGGQGYPVQAWSKEIAELREQMAILRRVAKRYVWAFTGNPSWYAYSPELQQRYGLKKQDLKRDDIDLRAWHEILRDKPVLGPSPLSGLVQQVERFDRGQVGAEQLCDAFGTPGRWWLLGILGNPHTKPQFAATRAARDAVDSYTVHQGRDDAVRWLAFDNFDPRGVTSCRYIFDWRNTDDASAHFVTFIHSGKRHEGFLHLGWDDGIEVRVGNQVVFSKLDYPKRGKGMLYQDKYQFEKRVPVALEQGRNRLAVTSVNSHGNWLFALRITDANDIPFEDVRFGLE